MDMHKPGRICPYCKAVQYEEPSAANMAMAANKMCIRDRYGFKVVSDIECVCKSDVIIDALFGTGLKRAIILELAPSIFSVILIISPCINASVFFSSRRRHTRSLCDWSSDVCSSDLIRKVWL